MTWKRSEGDEAPRASKARSWDGRLQFAIITFIILIYLVFQPHAEAPDRPDRETICVSD
jgi:hypothetical protein